MLLADSNSVIDTKIILKQIAKVMIHTYKHIDMMMFLDYPRCQT